MVGSRKAGKFEVMEMLEYPEFSYIPPTLGGDREGWWKSLLIISKIVNNFSNTETDKYLYWITNNIIKLCIIIQNKIIMFVIDYKK